MTRQNLMLTIVLCCIAALLFGCGKKEKTKPVVLFDQSHGQHFVINTENPLDLSRLAATLGKEGFEVRSSAEPITPALLEKVDALVISGPFKPVTDPEIRAITAFLEKGGRLSVMLHIASPPAELLKVLGTAISNGAIREQQNILSDSPLNFRVTALKPHPLTDGLDGFKVYGCWALINTRDNAAVLATTGPQAWVDLNMDNQLSPGDAMQPLGVLVSGTHGKGAFAVFGDDAIFQNQFLAEENEHLAGNLAKWLKGE